MSGSFRRRHSKWDNKDTEAIPEDFHDKAQTRRPRDPLSPPSRSSQRNDSRSKDRVMSRDREVSNARTFTGPGESRQHHSRSPKNGWGRMYSRSRSRSRSRSPSHYLRREPVVNDRSRTKSGVSAQVCREFVAGRCRRGSTCHFLHEDAQPYDSRQPLDNCPPDDWESRHRKIGGSRYSQVDDKEYAQRTEKSMNICGDFMKGRCRKGASCRYEHRDLAGDVFMDEPIDDVHRDRDTFPKTRDTYSHRNQNHDSEPVDVFEKGPIDDIHRDRDLRSRDTYSHRNHDREPVDVFEKRPINDVPRDRDNSLRSRDTYSQRNRDREPGDMFEKRPVDDVPRDRDSSLRSRDTYNHRNHDREPADLFEKRPVVDVLRDRDNPRRSRDTYQNHDREPSNVFEKGSVDDSYRDRDNDHRGRDAYRNHDREPHKRGEALCKFFASGNCKNGNRCRFVHEVQERHSPARRSQDDKWGPDHKVESNQAWDGPSWSDMPKPNVAPLKGWGDEQNEAVEASDTNPRDNSWSHDTVNVKETWAPPAANDGFQVKDEKPPLQWVSENSVEIVSGDMKLSPKDSKQHPVSFSNSLSLSNVSVETARPDAVGEAFYDTQYPIGYQEQKVYNEPHPMHNPSHKVEKPDVYHEESRNIISDPIPTMNAPHHQGFFQNGQNAPQQGFFQNEQNGPQQGFFQNEQNAPQQGFFQNVQNAPQQGFFQNEQIAPQQGFLQTVGVQPSSGFTPPATQGQAPFPSEVSGRDGIQLSHNPASFHSSVAADGPQHVNTSASGLVSATAASLSTVSNEQLAQLSNLSASLAQLLENRQLPLAQLAPASIPPVMDPTMQTIPVPETFEQQYDPLRDSVEQNVKEQKTEKIAPDEEGGEIKQEEHVIVTKDDEKVKEITEGSKKDLENRPPVDGHFDEGEDGNKSKDIKAIRPFKFALAEFVKELLKPSWKDGQVSKDAYKAIVKKVVDKIIETQGLQVPQTKEKIDHYLSCSKPKIEKLVQAYVGKFQKT